MGLTKHTFDLLTKAGLSNKDMSILEIGDQIIYFGEHYGMYSTPYFSKFYPKCNHLSIDIKPENYALQHDVREPLKSLGMFDMITDAGSFEHIEGESKDWYNAWKNIHDVCNIGGVMIHENPKTGNWKGHGYHYQTIEFYTQLCKVQKGYILEDVGEHPAMGNITDGWNIYAVIRKEKEVDFMTFKEFDNIYKKYIHSK